MMKYTCKVCGAELPADMTKECECVKASANTADGAEWVVVEWAAKAAANKWSIHATYQGWAGPDTV
jgi:hypothetical protein